MLNFFCTTFCIFCPQSCTVFFFFPGRSFPRFWKLYFGWEPPVGVCQRYWKTQESKCGFPALMVVFFFFFCQAMEMCCSCELAVMWCWLHYNVAVSQPPETRGSTRRAPSISNNSMVMAETHKRMIQEISSPLLLFSPEIEVETLRRSQSEDTGTSEQLYGT